MAAENQRHPTDRAATPLVGAYRYPSAILLFLVAAATGLAADLMTKHWAFRSLLTERQELAAEVRDLQRRHELADRPAPTTRRILQELHVSRPLCRGVRLTLSTNSGVVFGMPMNRGLVLAATAMVLGIVVWFFATSGPRQYWLHAALGMILAGAVGNQWDRLFSTVRLPELPELPPIRMEVRDFIDCSGLYYPWIFNVADALLVVGVALILLHSLPGRRRGPTKPAG